jgi:Zn-dependent M28 family amino/carboxypeptidase
MGRAAALIGRKLQPDHMPEAGAFYRNDTYPFVKRGVPAIFSVGGPLSTEPEDSAVNRALMDYVQNKYHKPTDEYDAATWDLRGVEEDVRVYFEAGLQLANETRFPNWQYETEFRLLRDRMMARRKGTTSAP